MAAWTALLETSYLWIPIAIFVAAIAYLLGSIPTGYWLGRLRGIDIREHGSKSTGATNVLRTLGKVPALMVLLVDMLKGVAALAFTRWFYELSIPNAIPAEVDFQSWIDWAITLAALMAVLGHSKSIWINFTGGKSAATGLGVLFGMAWQVGLGGTIVFGLALAISRIVSLSSIATVLSAMVLMVVLQQPLPFQIATILGGTYVIWCHRANIQRLLAGTEPRVGQKHSTVESK
ncbi:MAG TPA: glycerol-3-phosphate 1-O-acyltransferase PlsY [Coleofasciculaceae cyanobacterium]|jgi:glycerol-3-phosphate acyltransferase PlsY